MATSDNSTQIAHTCKVEENLAYGLYTVKDEKGHVLVTTEYRSYAYDIARAYTTH